MSSDNYPNIESDRREIREIFSAIKQSRLMILVVTSLFTAASLMYSLSLKDIYRSEALLAPVAESSGMKLPSQLGGLASLAGVSLGNAGNIDKAGLAIEIMKSREFIGRFINRYDLYVPLMASNGWGREYNTLVIDENVYDATKGIWLRSPHPPFLAKPSVLEAYEVFISLLSVSKDKFTGMLTISFKHYSPYIAKDIVEKLVDSINEEMRNRELDEAQKSIAYLTSQIELTNVSDVRTMLYSLIEEQTKTLMLTNVRDEFVFSTVDPAIVAERRYEPKRVLIVLATFITTFFVSIFVVIFRLFISSTNKMQP